MQEFTLLTVMVLGQSLLPVTRTRPSCEKVALSGQVKQGMDDQHRAIVSRVLFN
jgi:hypothetical protein